MDDNKYKIASHVAWRRVEDEIVVLDLETSIYYSLNEVASRIWELIHQGKGASEISQALTKEYEVDGKRVQKDASSFVAELKKEKLIA